MNDLEFKQQVLDTKSASGKPNVTEITSLFHFLNDIDVRRNISWRKTFPWLVDEFAKYNLI